MSGEYNWDRDLFGSDRCMLLGISCNLERKKSLLLWKATVVHLALLEFVFSRFNLELCVVAAKCC